MTAPKTYRDRLDHRPGFPIRRPSIDGNPVERRPRLGAIVTALFGRGQGA